MEFKKFEFSPQDGFLNSAFYEDTPENPREILQRQHNQTKDFINSVVDKLNSDIEGESGIEMIKSPQIEGVYGDNAFSQLKSIKTQLDNIALKEIPDNSLGENKLKVNSISSEKIKDGAVTTSKFSSDATVPYSDEALNINGVDAKQFQPVFASSTIGVYKECFGKVNSAYFLEGKTMGNKRYINSDGVISALNLETGEEETVADVSDITFTDFIVDEEEKLYLFSSVYTSGKHNLKVYQYKEEYGICTLIKEITVNSLPSSSYGLYKTVLNKDYIYLLMAYRTTSASHYYLYEIKREELNDTEETDSVGYTKFSDMRDIFFGCDENTIIYGDMSVYSRDFENSVKLNFTADDLSGGYIYSEGSNILLRNASDLSAKIIVCDNLKSFIGFIWNGYIYTYTGGYLARGRIL